MRAVFLLPTIFCLMPLSFGQYKPMLEKHLREAPRESEAYIQATHDLSMYRQMGNAAGVLSSVNTILAFHPERRDELAEYALSALVKLGRDQDAIVFADKSQLMDIFSGKRTLTEDDVIRGHMDSICRSLGLAYARTKRYDLSRSLWDEKYLPMRHLDMLPYVPRVFKDKELAEMWMIALTTDWEYSKQYQSELHKMHPENRLYEYWDYHPVGITSSRDYTDRCWEFIKKTRGHFRIYLEHCIAAARNEEVGVCLKRMGLKPTVLALGED